MAFRAGWTRHERARALLEDGLVVAQEIGDKGSIAYAWLLLAILAQSEGDPERATPWVQDSLALLQQVGDQFGPAKEIIRDVVGGNEIEDR